MESKKRIIRAGGGLVLNEREEILMIYRRGSWDLPKGKLDDGETLECCAHREVREECGIGELWVGRELCTTQHTYTHNGEHIEKHTSWYLMLAPGQQTLVPQCEEDIEEVVWVDNQRAKELLEVAYPTIREVFVAFDKYFSKAETNGK